MTSTDSETTDRDPIVPPEEQRFRLYVTLGLILCIWGITFIAILAP